MKKQKKEYSKQLNKLENRILSVNDETRQLARFEEEKQLIQAQRDKLTKKYDSRVPMSTTNGFHL